ncbi:Inosine/uridine-preferring nucleoside hydrolase domain-containing protein, partial [Pyronema omphalodes]
AEHPRFELLGISTVHGNASLPNVTRNALSLLTAINRPEIPVYSGARKPFSRPAVHAPDIHGSSGIDGTSLLPIPITTHSTTNAIVAMYNAIMSTPPQTCALVATGTLTNIALLFATFPETAAHVREVSIMGGAFGDREDSRGNITPYAEFNIYCDPEAAQSIFSNPELDRKITIMPLDITHTVLANERVLTRLMGKGGEYRRMLHELLTFFRDTYVRVFGITEGPPLHDPLAVAVVLLEEDVQWRFEEVRIEVTCSGPEVGRTIKTRELPEVVGDQLGGGSRDAYTRVRVPLGLNVEKFWDVLLGVVEGCDGRYEWPKTEGI